MPINPSDPVGSIMREYKAGQLHSGRSGKVVSNRKQAIAIGLSEQRRMNARSRKRSTGKR